jgi:hypothetical protein
MSIGLIFGWGYLGVCAVCAESSFWKQGNDQNQQDGHYHADDQPWAKCSVIPSAHPIIVGKHHGGISFEIRSECNPLLDPIRLKSLRG